MPGLSRRHALFAAAALPLAAGLTGGLVTPAAAKIERQGPGEGLYRRFRLGGFEITTLLAGSGENAEPRRSFGLNVSDAEFAAVSQAAFLPTDRAGSNFCPVLVNTGSELVLFDTGLAPEGILAALTQAGVSPQAVDVVVLTHMHGDHIGGLTMPDGATPVFPRARYVTGRAEFDYWSGQENEGFDKKVRPLAAQTRFVADGDEAAPGITALEAFGHTPGHMAWMLESDGKLMVLTADCANHFVWSLEHPDWEVRFDVDKAAAAATRKRIFGMIAADRLPFIGYHMPFPGLGYVEPKGEGFRYVPHSYQLSFVE
ncbi:MBL fold metallo-hydrolase [Pseudogemmobacter faecipullorum]|uniref:MBL fold metallo-hydrolase n=1 Tax=Pseudogemmobacter faecipullorum TaxID=2755041 RepID=A0ABS8CGN0_9RHOB|nr:MBL fold metallo-hydrolase [Pseudogemmobacter faecipullorum]MCB5408535.1 MBL fold metallo-hydrolase [Pseudogemmobacter faecipullorum]